MRELVSNKVGYWSHTPFPGHLYDCWLYLSIWMYLFALICYPWLRPPFNLSLYHSLEEDISQQSQCGWEVLISETIQRIGLTILISALYNPCCWTARSKLGSTPVSCLPCMCSPKFCLPTSFRHQVNKKIMSVDAFQQHHDLHVEVYFFTSLLRMKHKEWKQPSGLAR